MVNLYFTALTKYLETSGYTQQLSSCSLVLLASIILGFVITYKIHPKEGMCMFAGVRYKKQQKVIKFAAVIPAVYISIITLLEVFWQIKSLGVENVLSSNSTIFLILAWIFGIIGLYYFIKVDVGSKVIAILGHSRTGKTVLMTSMLGFMTDSKFTKDYRGVSVVPHSDINEFLEIDEAENVANILWDNYYNYLRFGSDWGMPTKAGSLASIGAKVKILPKIYSCITFRLFDHPGIRFESVVKLLNDDKIKDRIPNVLDRNQIENFTETITELSGYTDKRIAKEIAIILTLIKESEKVFYLLDGHKFVYDMINAGRLNITNEDVKMAITKGARTEGSIQKEFMDYMQLKQAVSSSFDKDVYLVFTKADILCLIADYCDDQDIKEFKDQFELGNYEKAKKILLDKILTKYGVVGYGQVSSLEVFFVVVGVMSKIEGDELKPRGGSCDDFIRIDGFMEVVKD
jgi:hypothetical protein